jgi:hypothetical protein
MLGQALAAGISLLAAQLPAERDWGQALRTDALALHGDLAANHPGTVNAEDPEFARRNDAQLRLALRRAEGARDYAAYFFALEAYVATFDDGHLRFGASGSTPSDRRWPGFLTAFGSDGAQRVVDREEDSPVPLGARLASCDGRSADLLAEQNVGSTVGRWSLLSQRMASGSWLFVDGGNPYVVRPARCLFEVEGRSREVTLDWRPIALGELIGRHRRFAPEPLRQFGARTLADGTRWIALGSFDANPQSEAGRALPPLIAALQADRAGLASAPAIVLDLRANNGGSSDWSRQIAEAIWGRAALDRLPNNDGRVDWRVSAANLAWLREGRERQLAGGAMSPEVRRWFDRVTTGLEGALARGEALWREPPDVPEPAAGAGAPPPPPARLSGPVYFITDSGCASACLDAVDLWRALGAIHLGQTTSADTLYMDVRRARLPSGIGMIVVPMKVYRGRSRGANEPVVPVHAFGGDISDSAAIERWIAGLPERQR